MALTVRYHAHHLELSGYGKAAAGYIEALSRTAAEVSVVPVVDPPVELEEVDIAIYHTTPARLADVKRLPAKRHVALTTWETMPMPLEHVKTLDGFDAVIVPSGFCKNRVEDGPGTIPKIHIVPHGFDPEFWTPGSSKEPNEVFTFYSIGAWGERKNMLGLLKAYLHAFRKADRTRLVLIIDKPNFQAIHSVLARSGIPQDELPGLLVPDRRLTDDEIRDLHRDGDCFVTATRAEGFGLPIFEAAILGKRVVSPAFGGQAEFLQGNPQWSHVWHFLTPVFPGEDDLVVENGQMTLKTTLARGSNCRQLWAEPSLDRLALELRRAQAEREPDRWDRRSWYESHYSFDVIGKKLLAALQEILR